MLLFVPPLGAKKKQTATNDSHDVDNEDATELVIFVVVAAAVIIDVGGIF